MRSGPDAGAVAGGASRGLNAAPTCAEGAQDDVRHVDHMRRPAGRLQIPKLSRRNNHARDFMLLITGSNCVTGGKLLKIKHLHADSTARSSASFKRKTVGRLPGVPICEEVDQDVNTYSSACGALCFAQRRLAQVVARMSKAPWCPRGLAVADTERRTPIASLLMSGKRRSEHLLRNRPVHSIGD